MIRKNRWTVLPLSVLLAVGCDVTPSSPELDGVEAELIEMVEASWSQLSTTEGLGLEALDAGATGEAHDLFMEASLMIAELDDARSEGMSGATTALEVEVEVAWAAFVQASLGPGVPERVVEDADRLLRELESIRSERAGEARIRMAQARERIRNARTALERGDGARALYHGARAASEIQSISPARRAHYAVNRAEALLARATTLAGPEVDGRIAEALELARAACVNARRALDGELWRIAVTEAQVCARISRAVIARLAGGIPDAEMADLAEAAVEKAGAYLDRVKEILDGDLPDGVQRALDQAAESYELARTALSQGSYRRTVVLAHESIALSRRILAWAMEDGTSVMEARARVAVETAQALLDRAWKLAGSDPEPHVAELLHRAEGLVSDAHAALEAGSWRMANYKAHTSIPILRRMIHYLS